jgi:hypothetical protein
MFILSIKTIQYDGLGLTFDVTKRERERSRLKSSVVKKQKKKKKGLPIMNAQKEFISLSHQQHH